MSHHMFIDKVQHAELEFEVVKRRTLDAVRDPVALKEVRAKLRKMEDRLAELHEVRRLIDDMEKPNHA